MRAVDGPSGARADAWPLFVVAVVAGPSRRSSSSAPRPAAAAVPAGFAEVTAFSGLLDPTAIRFAPDGRIFVAEKRGTIKMYDGLARHHRDRSWPTCAPRCTTSGTAVCWAWPSTRGFPARPYLYALYTFDGPIGGTAPRWGTAGRRQRPVPDAAGATADGCVVSGKLVRLTADRRPTDDQAGT